MSLPDKIRLDQAMAERAIVSTRSQAESFIKLGQVSVNGQIMTKPGHLVSSSDVIKLFSETYVSRAGLKLASIADVFGLDFKGKIVLDIGSSTGGFTDFALRGGAKKVIAVDVGTDQMHPSLKTDDRLELHEKTDIRSFRTNVQPDLVLIDVSFISLRQVLPSVSFLSGKDTQIIAMVKPQFEAGLADINKGVVKNDSVRRRILKDFESWVKKQFIVIAKADSKVAGSKGNLERFYLLKTTIGKVKL